MKYQIKEIEAFPGYYIDTNGDVWSAYVHKTKRDKKGRITKSYKVLGKKKKLKKWKSPSGYWFVILYREGKTRLLRRIGWTYKKISNLLHVHHDTVYLAANHKTWKHII